MTRGYLQSPQTIPGRQSPVQTTQMFPASAASRLCLRMESERFNWLSVAPGAMTGTTCVDRLSQSQLQKFNVGTSPRSIGLVLSCYGFQRGNKPMTGSSRNTLLASGALLLSAGAAVAAPATVQTDLNVRSGPGTQFAVVGTVQGGETVDVAGCTGRWCQISFSGGTGYANQSYLAMAGGGG